jgi:hypothetical protein
MSQVLRRMSSNGVKKREAMASSVRWQRANAATATQWLELARRQSMTTASASPVGRVPAVMGYRAGLGGRTLVNNVLHSPPRVIQLTPSSLLSLSFFITFGRTSYLEYLLKYVIL